MLDLENIENLENVIIFLEKKLKNVIFGNAWNRKCLICLFNLIKCYDFSFGYDRDNMSNENFKKHIFNFFVKLSFLKTLINDENQKPWKTAQNLKRIGENFKFWKNIFQTPPCSFNVFYLGLRHLILSSSSITMTNTTLPPKIFCKKKFILNI